MARGAGCWRKRIVMMMMMMITTTFTITTIAISAENKEGIASEATCYLSFMSATNGATITRGNARFSCETI